MRHVEWYHEQSCACLLIAITSFALHPHPRMSVTEYRPLSTVADTFLHLDRLSTLRASAQPRIDYDKYTAPDPATPC